MAATFEDKSIMGDQLVYVWKLTGVSGTGDSKVIGAFGDKSYAMWGTWDGGTVVLEGSWDMINNPPASGSWMTLTESDNSTAISLTADGKGAVLENPVYIRAKLSGATAADLFVVVTAPWRRR